MLAVLEKQFKAKLVKHKVYQMHEQLTGSIDMVAFSLKIMTKGIVIFSF